LNDTISSGPPTAEKAPPALKAALVAGATPRAIVPTDFEQVWRIAQVLVAADMVPKDFKGSIEKVSIALMHGLEIGLPPMQAIQKIAIINGRPAVWGDAVIGLVQARGADEYIIEQFEGSLQDGTLKAICKTKRKGKPNEVVRTFSIKQAQRARLWDTREKVKRFRNNQPVEVLNDSPWYRFPERMLQMRARGLCLRDVYADVLGGLYLAEELIEPGDDAIDVTPPEQQTVRKAPPPPVNGGVIEGKAEPAKNGNGAAKPAGKDPLDIPEGLRRTEQKQLPGPVEPDEQVEDGSVDEDEWLNSLENAYGGCEDLQSLGEKAVRLAEPMLTKVGDQAWDAAKECFAKHEKRIRETA
jgi:hypothetical protein